MIRVKKYLGFTLIEILIVVTMIGILAAIVIVNLSSSQAKARDSRRLTDLDQISKAFQMFYEEKGTYVVPSTGSGGEGWFNLIYAGGTVSIAKGLINAGFLSDILQDPSGDIVQSGSHAYMIYLTDKVKLSAYAMLENASSEQISTLDSSEEVGGPTACFGGSTSCGMNYAVTIVP